MVEDTGEDVAAGQSQSKQAMALVASYILLVIAVYWQTAQATVSIWIRSETYAHCFIIIPIAIWLVWRERDELGSCYVRPAALAQWLLIPAGFVWLLAFLTHVLVIQQLALTSIVILGVWSITGNQIARLLAFPLGFLFLAVPMGEDLVPPLMEFTATSTIWLIQLTGIPVYREGLYFTLPSGRWSVVEACSGVRYLIASFTLGLLYAHLNYRTVGKKLLFVLASIIIPILANTLRAYMIVMLGHLSDMTIATGVDHLIYGWIFFGVVMFLLFWIGSFWADDSPQSSQNSSVTSLKSARETDYRLLPAFFVALVLALAWPFVANGLDRAETRPNNAPLVAPVAVVGWSLVEQPRWTWQPRNQGADSELIQYYQSEDQLVALYIQHFVGQKQGEELVSGRINQFIDPKQGWHIAAQEQTAIELDGISKEVQQVILTNGKAKLLLWYWYRIGERYTANRYVAKTFEAIEALSMSDRGSSMIIIATELEEWEQSDQRGSAVLQSYVDDYLVGIEDSLEMSARGYP